MKDKQELVTAMLDYIAMDEIEIGSVLPSERNMASMFETSRGNIRIVLKELEHMGVVEIIPNRGAILKNKNPGTSAFARIIDKAYIDLQSLVELRISLEVTAAELAAERATEREIDRIQEEMLAYEKEASEYHAWDHENLRFHMEIIKASKNGAIIALMDSLLKDILLVTRTRRSEYTKERLQRSIDEHRMIFQAIRSHDPQGAAHAMSVHMKKIRDIADDIHQVLR